MYDQGYLRFLGFIHRCTQGGGEWGGGGWRGAPVAPPVNIWKTSTKKCNKTGPPLIFSQPQVYPPSKEFAKKTNVTPPPPTHPWISNYCASMVLLDSSNLLKIRFDATKQILWAPNSRPSQIPETNLLNKSCDTQVRDLLNQGWGGSQTFSFCVPPKTNCVPSTGIKVPKRSLVKALSSPPRGTRPPGWEPLSSTTIFPHVSCSETCY